MPSLLQIKPTTAANTTFHVTSHGVRDLKILGKPRHKAEFLQHLANHLSPTPTTNASRRPHLKLYDQVQLLAYCIMDNHFHLVLHQFSANGMISLLLRVVASYARNFNRLEAKGRGPVFDGRYAAKPLDELDPDYAKHMIAYVQLNDSIQQLDNPFASHQVIGLRRRCDWVDREAALRIFGGRAGYREFMNRGGPAIVESKLIKWGIDPARHPYRPI
jgi:hypothetical protein